jgi:hypothetical protein
MPQATRGADHWGSLAQTTGKPRPCATRGRS